jgi:hypothetical protein
LPNFITKVINIIPTNIYGKKAKKLSIYAGVATGITAVMILNTSGNQYRLIINTNIDAINVAKLIGFIH